MLLAYGCFIFFVCFLSCEQQFTFFFFLLNFKFVTFQKDQKIIIYNTCMISSVHSLSRRWLFFNWFSTYFWKRAREMQLCAQHVVCLSYMERLFAQEYGKNMLLFWRSVNSGFTSCYWSKPLRSKIKRYIFNHSNHPFSAALILHRVIGNLESLLGDLSTRQEPHRTGWNPITGHNLIHSHTLWTI